MASFILTAAAVLTTASNSADAQVTPFSVTGGGIVDFVPLQEGQTAFHFADGEATLLGTYHGEGVVRTDMITSPNPPVADFSSAEPFVFTGADGDELAFHYGRTDFGAAEPGEVQLFPAETAGELFALWVAEFNPVPEASTGRYASVIDGSFIMTARSDAFDPSKQNPVDSPGVGYTWEGDGWIEFVPEPASALLLSLGCCACLVRLRRLHSPETIRIS